MSEPMSAAVVAARTDDENGTFVPVAHVRRNARVRMDRGHVQRRRPVAVAASPYPRYAVGLCVYCGARHHAGDTCTGDALDHDERGR